MQRGTAYRYVLTLLLKSRNHCVICLLSVKEVGPVGTLVGGLWYDGVLLLDDVTHSSECAIGES